MNATTERGRFLAKEEVANFTASYDNFLSNAPGYSSESEATILDVKRRADSACTRSLQARQLSSRLVGSGRDVHHGLVSIVVP